MGQPAAPRRRRSASSSRSRTSPTAAAALTSPIEYRLRHRDGHPVWVRDDALMREGPDGVKRWHGVMSDITEQKDAEAELELRAAQQAAVARLGEHALQGASLADLMQEAVSAGVELLEPGDRRGGGARALRGRGRLPRAARPPRRARQRQIPGRTGVAVGLCPAQRPAGGGDRLGDRAALRALAGAQPRRHHERPDRRHRGPPRAVRSPGLPFVRAADCSSRATWTSCRRWPTSWATWWSASSPTTTSATEPCTIPSPGCPTGCCSWTASGRPPSASAAAATPSPPSWPSTSTASSSSTRASATAPGTSCSPPPRRGCKPGRALVGHGGALQRRRVRDPARGHRRRAGRHRDGRADRRRVRAAVRARRQRALRHHQHRHRAGRGRRARRGSAARRRRRHAPRQGARPGALRAVRRGAARAGPVAAARGERPAPRARARRARSCTTSRWCRCATARWSPWRRWCAGSIPSAAGSPPSTSSRWPRRTG